MVVLATEPIVRFQVAPGPEPITPSASLQVGMIDGEHPIPIRHSGSHIGSLSVERPAVQRDPESVVNALGTARACLPAVLDRGEHTAPMAALAINRAHVAARLFVHHSESIWRT